MSTNNDSVVFLNTITVYIMKLPSLYSLISSSRYSFLLTNRSSPSEANTYLEHEIYIVYTIIGV